MVMKLDFEERASKLFGRLRGSGSIQLTAFGIVLESNSGLLLVDGNSYIRMQSCVASILPGFDVPCDFCSI
jgi:hypothetical protein